MGGHAVGEAFTRLVKGDQVVYEGSIADFLRSAPDYQSAMAVYLQAVKDASEASEGTKRKWRSIVEGKPGVIS